MVVILIEVGGHHQQGCRHQRAGIRHQLGIETDNRRIADDIAGAKPGGA